MTAFARDEQKVEGTEQCIELCWEIRTVNHRHLDINLHIPDILTADENNLKEIIRNKLGRGRLDAKLTVHLSSSNNHQTIQLDEEKTKTLLAASQRLQQMSGQISGLTVSEILQWPGVVKEAKTQNEAYSVALSKSAKELLESTLNSLINMRETEGRRLSVMITTRCESAVKLIQSVRSRRVEVVKALREKIVNKLSELDVIADNNRLEQELVYQAQRLDVDEELDRLGAHIDEIYAVLKRDEPVGRRLDFLMQELNREANTLTSKSNDAETTKSAVELKVLIEQMREQCLNIE